MGLGHWERTSSWPLLAAFPLTLKDQLHAAWCWEEGTAVTRPHPWGSVAGDAPWVASVAEVCPEPHLCSLSPSAGSASATVPLRRSPSLPSSATVTLGVSDPSALSSSALSERDASRLDKFRQLLGGPNTDLGKSRGEAARGCALLLGARIREARALSLSARASTPATC